MKSLNWLTTMPKRRPAAFRSPRNSWPICRVIQQSHHVLRSCERHQRVAAALAHLVESSFGAIDPFGHAVLGFVARPRRSFRHHGADGQVLGTPRGRPRRPFGAVFPRARCAFSSEVFGKMKTSDQAVYFTAISVWRMAEERACASCSTYCSTAASPCWRRSSPPRSTCSDDQRKRRAVRAGAIGFHQQAIDVGTPAKQARLFIRHSQRTNQRAQPRVTHGKHELVAHRLQEKTLVRLPLPRRCVSDKQGAGGRLRFLIRQHHRQSGFEPQIAQIGQCWTRAARCRPADPA